MCSIIQNTRRLLACAWAGLAVLVRTDTTACLVRTFWFGGTYFLFIFFFVAKCNLWIHYIAHTFLVSASCLIIAKKIGPDPFHNKYMCSCCCCCCGCTTNWQQKCCFSKAQLASCVLEIFSTFQHKARLFFHRLDRLCCWIMQVDTMNTIFFFLW